ncbi:MAG: nucleoside deaminase [Tissierella sp.]|nr:nucleoside deaminase [Tissierella sp.]
MDIIYMKEALKEASIAYSTYEVPIGAVIVYDGQIIGRGYNKKEKLKNPLAHAELIAIDQATKYLGQWRLTACTMYVTLEPCAMCAGALINSRIDRLVIGARDQRMGCAGTVENITCHDKFNHKIQVEHGVLEEECSSILSDFFKMLRSKR